MAMDISSTAAPWLTFSLATMYRVYGSAIGPVRLGRRDEFRGAALDRRRGVRVGCGDQGKRANSAVLGGYAAVLLAAASWLVLRRDAA